MKRLLFVGLRLLVIFGLLLASYPSTAIAYPGVVLVKVGGIASGTCGGTWAAACDLQYALKTIAVSGDELWVAAGTYVPTADSDRYASFQLRSGIEIYGGFAGTESSRDARNFSTNITVLSGNIGDANSPDDNAYHVVTGSGTDATAVLDGFTISDGNADLYYEEPHYMGAGVINVSGSPTFTNLIITNNTALDLYGSGGGMFNYQSNPVLTNVLFSNNSVSYDGGGMLNISSNPILINVTFDSNSATGSLCGTGTCGNGGAIDNTSSHPTLTNVTFTNNTAHYYGGAIHTTGTNPMTNVLFYNNSARFGGAVYGGGNITLRDVVFDHNTAISYGGGTDMSGSPTLINVTFTSNSADEGGGFYSYFGAPILTNVTFSGNTARRGGGMSAVGQTSAPVLTNVTFKGNTAEYYGGAIYKSSDYTATGIMTVRNSIFWGNTASEKPNIDEYPVSTVVSDSVVQGGFAGGTNIITADPLLGTLGDWGGLTPTIPLLPGSSAINAGNNSICPTTDQRGITRTPLAPCDIGAFESRGFTVAKTTGDNQTTDTSTAFAAPLGLTISSAHGEPVNGGVIRFTAPPSGASTNPATNTATIAAGAVSKSVTANSVGGSYQVRGDASGVTSPVFYRLTNKTNIQNVYLPTLQKVP